MSLARDAVRALPAYRPSASAAPARVDLSDNTNLWGTPPAAGAALARAAAGGASRYPSLYAGELKAAVAAYAGCAAENVVTGCGSDDVLDCAIRAFAGPGDALAFPDPTFVMLPQWAALHGLAPRPVPLVPGTWDVDADGLLATGARVIYLCSVNNPTGTLASRAAVERILERAPGLVLLDEAYGEFARASYLDEGARRGNVLVTRTLSKAFGLAGLRVGYGVGSPSVVAEVEKVRGPYKVSLLAEAAAVAALREDVGWVRARAAEAVEVRGRLVEALRADGLAPLPSEGNFVLVPLPGAPAAAARLRERGVAVRPFAGLTGIGDALRIGCGPWEQVRTALDALREVRS